MPHPLLIILTGPSGSGKSTILDLLKARKPFPFQRFITCTTRAKRPGEKNGTDYWFVTREDFEQDLKKNRFFESAEVYGNYYGSSKKEFERLATSKKPILMVLDVQGAETMKRAVANTFIVFLDASKKALTDRLKKRGTDAAEMKRRTDQLTEEEMHRGIADTYIKNKEGEIEETYQVVVEASLDRFRRT